MVVILRILQRVESLPDYSTLQVVNQQYFLREDMEKANMLAMELNRYFSNQYGSVYSADVIEV